MLCHMIFSNLDIDYHIIINYNYFFLSQDFVDFCLDFLTFFFIFLYILWKYTIISQSKVVLRRNF